MPYQQDEYNQLQEAIPCCYRGDLELRMKPSNCCIGKEIVASSKFYCAKYDKYITNNSVCWGCSERKSEGCNP